MKEDTEPVQIWFCIPELVCQCSIGLPRLENTMEELPSRGGGWFFFFGLGGA